MTTVPSITPAQLTALQAASAAATKAAGSATTSAAAATSAAKSATTDAASLAKVVAAIAANTPTPPSPPAVSTVPTGLVATSPAAGQLAVAWVPPAAGQPAGGYDVKRSGYEADGKTSLDWHTPIAKDQTSFLFGNLGPLSTHTMTVTPLLADGTLDSKSAASIDGTVQGTAPTPPPVNPPPVNPPSGPTQPFGLGNFLRDESQYANYDAQMQKTAYASVFQYRPDEATMCSMSACDTAIAAGKIPVVSFQGIVQGGSEDRNTLPLSTFTRRATSAGTNSVAKGPLGAQTYYRCGTEINNGSAGDPPVDSNNPVQVARWAQTVAAMAQGFAAVPNGSKLMPGIDMSLDPGNAGFNPINLLQAALGSYKWVGLDIYDAACPWGQDWSDPATQWNNRYLGVNGGTGYKTVWDWCLQHNIPIGMPETGEGYFYDNGGATQEPVDGGSVFVRSLYNAALTHGVKVLFINWWEDNNGLFLTGGKSQPNTLAAWKSTFGSKPSLIPA